MNSLCFISCIKARYLETWTVDAINSKMSPSFIIDTGPPSEVTLINYFTFSKATHVLKIRILVTYKGSCITWLYKTQGFSPQNCISQDLNLIDLLLRSRKIKTSKEILKRYLNIDLNNWWVLAYKINGSLF